jgi:hypothetical protein
MERLIKNSIKYRIDFLPENYNELKIKCTSCKKIKNSYLFPNDVANIDKKKHLCKHCSNESARKRRSNHTPTQIVNNMLNNAKKSSIKRVRSGRTDCGEFTLTTQDIFDLVKKQNNRCFFTKKEFIWKYNNNNKPSIDRIDCNRGYTKDNINMVTFIVNQYRSDLLISELKSLSFDITNTNKYYGCNNNYNTTIVKKRIKHLLKSSKSSCKTRLKKGRTGCGEFALTTNDILDLIEKQNNRCFFSKRELVWESKSKNMGSIDRIDCDKGYTKDNINLVCFSVNTARSDLSIEDFLNLSSEINQRM